MVYSGREVESAVHDRLMALIEKKGIFLQKVQAGDTLGGLGKLRLYVLHPFARRDNSSADRPLENLNDASIVLKLVYGETSVLLTGDLEDTGERHLLHSFGAFVDCDVVKIGHHGSSTSSSLPFLREVTPRIGIISVGEFNRFNHPSSEVLKRLRRLQVDFHRTDEEGAVVLESDGMRISMMNWR